MRPRTLTIASFFSIAMAATLLGALYTSQVRRPAPAQASTALAAPQVAPGTAIAGLETFRDIARAVNPGVVNINTSKTVRLPRGRAPFFGDDLMDQFFGPVPEGNMPERRQTRTSLGSGFVIDKAGYILTNRHVVEGADQIDVAFPDGTRYEAKVVGQDARTDVALVKIEPKGALTPVPLGDSDKAEVGEWVMAVGNPFGLPGGGNSVTVGVVSFVGRDMRLEDWRRGTSVEMIQTDAAINPGNSGGPLLNIRGEVVGINTAIYTGRQQGNLGIGFAVPINAVRELLPQLRAGKVTRGRIGVSLARQVQKDVLEQLGAKDGRGALVQQVESGGPAQKAGLQPGDVIVEFNGKPVQNNDELVNQVVRTTPGTSVPIKVLRGGEARSLSVTVAELDLEAEGGRQADEEGEGNTATGFGMTLQDVTPEIARQLRAPTGTAGAVVVEVEPRSPAARAFLQPRDIILEVNRKSVASASEASRELQKVRSGQIATLLVLRGGQEVFLTIRKE